MKKEVYLYVPAELDMPEEFRQEAEYWLHTVLVGRFARHHDPDDTTRINRRLIQSILNSKREPAARRWLLERGVIYTDHVYSAGNYSKSYGLNPQYANKITRVPVRSRRLARRILDARNKRLDLKHVDATRRRILLHLQHWINRFTFNLPACEASTTPDDFNLLTAREIAEGNLQISTDDFGRVHSPYTRLLTAFRRFISYGNPEAIVHVDVRNSQILFLCQLFMQSVYSNNDKEPNTQDYSQDQDQHITDQQHRSRDTTTLCYVNDNQDIAEKALKFIELTQEGRIYDYLLELTDKAYLRQRIMKQRQRELWQKEFIQYAIANKARKAEEWRTLRRKFARGRRPKDIEVEQREAGRGEFKRLLFADVFYGPPVVKTPITEVFATEFAEVYNFICHRKNPIYENLAREMQRAESRLIIDCVCRRLMEHHPEVPILTIHDSIGTTAANVALVKRLITEEFGRIELRPTLRTTE